MRAYCLTRLSDAVLLADLAEMVERDRATTAELLAYLSEVDARRLFLSAGYPSLYVYCIDKLHLSEDVAFKRIQAARVCRRFPMVFVALAEGRLHLTAVCLLAPYLTPRNVDELLALASHQRKWEIEKRLASRFPRTERMTLVEVYAASVPVDVSARASVDASAPAGTDSVVCNSLPAPEQVENYNADGAGAVVAPGDSSPPEVGAARSESRLDAAPSEPGSGAVLDETPSAGPDPVAMPDPDRARPVPAARLGAALPERISPSDPRTCLVPLATQRFALQVTLAQSTYDKLRHALALLSHVVPEHDIAEVLDRALDVLIRQLERQKLGAAEPRARRKAVTGPRYVPASVRRAVWERDRGQCTFVSESGHRCEERRFLEFDHMDPVALGGLASVERIRLRCRAHNQYEAERVFGAKFMSERRGASTTGAYSSGAHSSPDANGGRVDK